MKKILVVDDEEGVLAMTRAALENYGYNVTTTTNGLEALTRFRENPEAIHLVITDHAMPFMDGKSVIAVLRKIRPDIKIIVASGLEKETEELLQHSKINGVIPKPFATDKLLAIVHDTLTKRV